LRSTAFVRGALTLAVAVLLGGTLLAAPAGSATAVPAEGPARQASCRIPHCWAAISFNTDTGYSGWAVDKRSQVGASLAAITRCKARQVNSAHRPACQRPGARKVYTENGCVAVVFRRRNGVIVDWAKGKSYGPLTAIRQARQQVNNRPGQIVMSRYACSRRHVPH
jgi:hypothetical protein